jgi:hypothetical protein
LFTERYLITQESKEYNPKVLYPSYSKHWITQINFIIEHYGSPGIQRLIDLINNSDALEDKSLILKDSSIKGAYFFTPEEKDRMFKNLSDINEELKNQELLDLMSDLTIKDNPYIEKRENKRRLSISDSSESDSNK